MGSSTATRNKQIDPKSQVRDVWTNKFVVDSAKNTNSQNNGYDNMPRKKPRIDSELINDTSDSEWKQIDDDIQIKQDLHEIIDILDDDDEDENDNNDDDNDNVGTIVLSPPSKHPKLTASERQTQIKREILLSFDDDANDSDIELIDDDFDDDNITNASIELSDSNVINDLFGADTLLADFNSLNNVLMRDPENVGRPNKEVISCPICQEKMCRELLSDHLNGCQGIKVVIGKGISKATSSKPKLNYKKPSTSKKSDRSLLADAGYSKQEIDRALNEKKQETEYNQRILNEMEDERRSVNVVVPSKKVPCPVCQTAIAETVMNAHLDACLIIDSD